MLFQSNEFLVFFLPIALILFNLSSRMFGQRGGVASLLVLSVAFYSYGNSSMVLLLAGSTIANFLIGEYIAVKKSAAALTFAVIANIGALIYFKYANFFLGIASAVSGVSFPQIDVYLPLAISFFTFIQIAYVADVYVSASARHSFIDYALFVTFFPHLIAGPLVRHNALIAQFPSLGDRSEWRRDIAMGATVFIIGLFKKIILADGLAPIVDHLFGQASTGLPLSFGFSWLGALAVTLNIYFDFSGYSDMALGLSRMFGLRLPVNFLSPLRASNLSDFWSAWHITLTTYFREYFYTPIAVRFGRMAHERQFSPLTAFVLGTSVPTIATFFVLGLWHGAGWQYVAFGVYHGIGATAHRAWRLQKRLRAPVWLGRVATMMFVCAGFAIFHSEAPATALRFLEGMAGLNGIALPNVLRPIAMDALGLYVDPRPYSALLASAGFSSLAFLAGALLVSQYLPNVYEWMGTPETALGWKPRPSQRMALRWRAHWVVALGLIIILLTAFWRNGENHEFLYFQF